MKRAFGGILAALGAAAVWASPAPAGAAGGEGTSVEIRRTRPTKLNHQPVRGLEPRLGRELSWNRLLLSDDLPLRLGDGALNLRMPALLRSIDTRDPVWLTQPRAITSTASAVGMLLTGRVWNMDVRQNGRVRQRHSVRTYFRSRGLKLVWRIEF